MKFLLLLVFLKAYTLGCWCVISVTVRWLKNSWHLSAAAADQRSRSWILKLHVKVLRQRFKMTLFPNPTTNFVHVWYDGRYWSKFLHRTIFTPTTSLQAQGHRLRSFMLKFYVKVLKTSLFPDPTTDFIYVWSVWYDDRYLTKILCSTISTSLHPLKVKVTDLEFLS